MTLAMTVGSNRTIRTIATIAAAALLLTACESSIAPQAAIPPAPASPQTVTPQSTPTTSKDPSPPDYTVFSSCAMGRQARRPDFQALTCGDAGLQLVNIRYDKYTETEATGEATVFTRPTSGTDPDDVVLRSLRFPVTFRAFRVQEWKGWHYFTRLRLDFFHERPPRIAEFYAMPMIGPLAPKHPPARTGPFLAAGGHLCSASKLNATARRGEGAGGWNIGGFTIRNIARRDCALRGPVAFLGLDATGTTVTSVSVCDRSDFRHKRCAAPVVLGQSDGEKLRRFPGEVSIQMYGWSRGGKRETTCPVDRQVRPVTFQVTVGGVILQAPNPPGHKAMWGCDDVTIAGLS